MTEIHVERRTPMIWPWISGLLLLSVIVWALMEMYGSGNLAPSGSPVPDSVSLDTGTASIDRRFSPE